MADRIKAAAAVAEPAVTLNERRALWLAAAWGFAEATFFFIVPDVLSSRLVLKRTRTGFIACLASLVGALLGGVLLYQIGSQAESRESALGLVNYLPGINSALTAKAQDSLSTHGLAALFVGVLGGIPYKLYALQAAPAGIGSGAFLLASAGARLGRFILVTGIAWLAGATLFRNYSIKAKLRIHAGAWVVFYAAYFWRMGL